MIMVNIVTIVMVMMSRDTMMMTWWSQYNGECDDHGDNDYVKSHDDDYGDDSWWCQDDYGDD